MAIEEVQRKPCEKRFDPYGGSQSHGPEHNREMTMDSSTRGINRAELRRRLRERWQTIDDSDIYLAARFLIDQRGPMADTYAAGRGDEYLAEGDLEGHAAWRRILKAVEELLRDPSGGDRDQRT